MTLPPHFLHKNGFGHLYLYETAASVLMYTTMYILLKYKIVWNNYENYFIY